MQNNTIELWNHHQFPKVIDNLMEALTLRRGKADYPLKQTQINAMTFQKFIKLGTYVNPDSSLRNVDHKVDLDFEDLDSSPSIVNLFGKPLELSFFTGRISINKNVNIKSFQIRKRCVIDLDEDKFVEKQFKELSDEFELTSKRWKHVPTILSYVKQEKVPKGIVKIGTGIPYSFNTLKMINGKLDHEKSFVSIDINTGLVYSMIPKQFMDILNADINLSQEKYEAISVYLMHLYTVPDLVALTLNYDYEKRYLWNVEASETKRNSATFGVHQSQICSLFKCREEPLSKTGRRRPILHWVEAHQRTLRNGDILEVPRKLRGITEFVLGGTKFKITQPIKGEEEIFEG